MSSSGDKSRSGASSQDEQNLLVSGQIGSNARQQACSLIRSFSISLFSVTCVVPIVGLFRLNKTHFFFVFPHFTLRFDYRRELDLLNNHMSALSLDNKKVNNSIHKKNFKEVNLRKGNARVSEDLLLMCVGCIQKRG